MRQMWFCALVFAGIATNASGANESEQEDQKLIVTGSMIKKADQQGPSPILTLSKEDLQRMGHTNLYDALVALTAQTGSLSEGDQFPNGFTSAAQALNLRGFGPGRTLVLVNGQRLALNPTPYQSEANFFNFATIPTIAIERVDVLTDGASSIYGSDAIAGVVNVILREEFEPNEVIVTYGSTLEGGGNSIKIAGGNSFRRQGQLFTFGYQWEKRDPVYGKDRDYLNSYLDFPDFYGNFVPEAIFHFDYNTLNYVVPSLGVCGDHPDLVSGPFDLYCGRDDVGDENIRNKRERLSAYLHSETETSLGPWFNDLIFWQSETDSRNFRLGWSGIYYGNDGAGQWDGGQIHYLFRQFSPLETGNQDKRFDEQMISWISGFEGMASSFDYRIQFTHSQYDHKRKALLLRGDEINNFFLDPVGYVDDQGQFVAVGQQTELDTPIIGSPTGDIFTRYTPGQLSSVLGYSQNNANSSSTNLSYWMSGQGPMWFDSKSDYALVIEWNQSDYDIAVDSTTENFGWFNVGGSSGRGERERFAIGGEWLIPLLRESSWGDLELTLAARWDDYQDDSDVGDARTWKTALDWAISSSVSLRAVHSTSFRAPDLHYLFADNTRYFIKVVDLYECVVLDSNSFADCENDVANYSEQITVDWAGTTELEEEKGKTQTFGIVIQPRRELLISADMYDITLRNQVGLQLESQYLLWETQCVTGINYRTGGTVDPNSSVCQDALSRVQRFQSADSFIQKLTNTPVNRAFRRQKGIDIGLNWFRQTEGVGTFGVDFRYSHILKTEIQELAGEPSTFDPDFRNSPKNSELATRANATLSWTNDQWSSALSVYHKGSHKAFDGSTKLGSWNVFNLITKREFADQHELALIVRNLTNKKPPIDSSRVSWPFFNRGQYDAIGTEWFLEYKIRY